MDEKFLSFLSDLFAMAAQGKKNLKDVTDWVERGGAGYDDLTRIFKEFYRLDPTTDDAAGWQTAAVDFKTSYDDYLRMMGVVPQGEHLQLEEKYERLKKKSAEQAETIRHLEMLLKQEGNAQGELSRDFARLMADQTDQFQEAMKKWSRLFESDD